jgi:toxin ParE1/3/4
VKPYAFHPEAQLEADGAAAYYHFKNPVSSRDFIEEMSKLILEIREAPQRWPFETGTPIQRRVFRRFPYTLLYRNDLHPIYIIAIAHTSRRPGYWKKRIAVD